LLAGRLQAGDICQAIPSLQVAGKNLLPATAPILPDLNGEHYWLLIGQLNSGRSAFEGAEQLRSLLELYDFGAFRGAERGRPKQRCAEAIHSVQAGNLRGIVDGDAMLGLGMSIELQEAGFASHGDAFLFGSILNELFAASVTMNSFIDLMVRLLPSKNILAWKPTRGTHPVV
jgi:type VI secretion system protein ImpG